MLVDFFLALREGGVPATIGEFLQLLGGLQAGLVAPSLEEFYFLARLCLVKDERHYDRFDRAFSAYFQGVASVEAVLGAIPPQWLEQRLQRELTEQEKALVQGLGGLEALMKALRDRLAEQKERHEGGSKWIGTGGTSPFGSGGYNPEGVRIGGDQPGQRRAVKVWEAREYRNLDDEVELGTRNIKVALRRLRRFAREGAPEELDLDGTITATARQAGMLDLHMVPERRNAIKVLLFLDIGGSMDDHVKVCEELFSAARSQFKQLEYFYFHNCIYESVWKDNRRRHSERHSTLELLRRYGRDYRLVMVGDATMSPYEVFAVGGSVEHNNPEPGSVWIQRLTGAFPHCVWLNPQPERQWDYHESIGALRQLMENRMFPLTLAGLEAGMRALSR